MSFGEYITTSGKAAISVLKIVPQYPSAATKKKFFKKNPLCHWCHCLMTIKGYNDSIPLNFCTIDHIYSKKHPNRVVDSSTVLACHECNKMRNNAEGKAHKRPRYWEEYLKDKRMKLMKNKAKFYYSHPQGGEH